MPLIILSQIQNEKLEVPFNKVPPFVDKITQPFNGLISYKDRLGAKKIQYEPNDKLVYHRFSRPCSIMSFYFSIPPSF